MWDPRTVTPLLLVSGFDYLASWLITMLHERIANCRPAVVTDKM